MFALILKYPHFLEVFCSFSAPNSGNKCLLSFLRLLPSVLQTRFVQFLWVKWHTFLSILLLFSHLISTSYNMAVSLSGKKKNCYSG